MSELPVRLPQVTCPECQSIIIARDAEVKAVTQYSDCLRRCEKCGVGFSNGVPPAQKNCIVTMRHGSQNALESAV